MKFKSYKTHTFPFIDMKKYFIKSYLLNVQSTANNWYKTFH